MKWKSKFSQNNNESNKPKIKSKRDNKFSLLRSCFPYVEYFQQKRAG